MPSNYCKTCSIKDEEFELHPYAGMFWSKQNILFVSDTHFGKVSHFRKSGLAVPMAVIERNWGRLIAMIEYFNPNELVFLGDLFHSDYNKEWESFQMISDTFYDLQMTLVLGNHDILEQEYYHRANLRILETLELGPFIFSHEPLIDPILYNIYGHIHPAVRMQGKGKQSMKLPCFYFGEYHAIMPAFGAFTGTMIIPIKKDDQVYLIANNKILKAN